MTLSVSEEGTNVTKGGPATQEGKEVVRWNATRHGIRSPAPVIPGREKHEDWEEHRDGVLESLSPEGHLEEVLAERVALLSWRLHRVIRYETEAIALYQERVEDDLAKERRFETSPDHPDAVRSNAKSAREEHRLLKRFAKMEDDKPLSSFDADSVIWDAVECADKVAEGEVDGLVRVVVEQIAQATDEVPEELVEAATRSARWKVDRTRLEAEQVERHLQNMSRERLLPDDETLNKVARYEAHLSRLFHKALHELEALQTRRSGNVAPLARLDIEGLESQ